MRDTDGDREPGPQDPLLDALWDRMYQAIRANRDGELMIFLREQIEAEAALLARRAPGDGRTELLEAVAEAADALDEVAPPNGRGGRGRSIPGYPHKGDSTKWDEQDRWISEVVTRLRALAADSRPEQPASLDRDRDDDPRLRDKRRTLTEAIEWVVPWDGRTPRLVIAFLRRRLGTHDLDAWNEASGRTVADVLAALAPVPRMSRPDEQRALAAGTHEPAVDDFGNQYLSPFPLPRCVTCGR